MRLAILLDDRITDWDAKGEILPAYFNPAGVADHITIVGLLADKPAAATLAALTAPAKWTFISVDMGRFGLALRTLGMRPVLLRRALRSVLKGLREQKPDLIRAYGDGFAAAAAGVIGPAMGVPYIISLHATPDPVIRRQYASLRDRFWRWLLAPSVEAALRGAQRIIAVYSPILSYLSESVRGRAVVLPNVVAAQPQAVRHENGPDRTGSNLRLLWIGRLIPGRDPTPVIEAVSSRQDMLLTVVGSGPLLPTARDLAARLGIDHRVRFIPALANAQLIAELGNYEVLVLRTDYAELAKPVMEAALAGLVVVINRQPSAMLDEYRGFPVVFTDATAESYSAAFCRLADDCIWRQDLARQTYVFARQHWNPDVVARRIADIMRDATANKRDIR